MNNQPYVPLQDFYVIKGQVPIMQVTINGQTYYVILAEKINPGDIAGFYTYDKWVPNFEVAINMPGTTVASIPGDASIWYSKSLAATVLEQTKLYQPYGDYFGGGDILMLSNGTKISYGVTINIAGGSLSNFVVPPPANNLSS